MRKPFPDKYFRPRKCAEMEIFMFNVNDSAATVSLDTFYRFNLVLAPEEVVQISDTFYVENEEVTVYKKNGSVYAEFSADFEKNIDRNIDNACQMILHHYPHLNLTGVSFEA